MHMRSTAVAVLVIMGLMAYAHEEHSCGSSTWRPTCKNLYRLKSRSYVLFVGNASIPVFLPMVWFSSITMLDCTWHRTLWTCCKCLVGKCYTILHTVQIWHQAIKEHLSGHHFTCDTFSVYCPFPLLQSGLWFMGAEPYFLIHLHTSTHTHTALVLRPFALTPLVNIYHLLICAPSFSF